MKPFIKRGLASLFSYCLLFSPLESVEIIFWHAFDGPLADVFSEIVEDFNHHSGSYKVVLVKKGNYKEVVEQGLEAFKTGDHPHILQGYEVAMLNLASMPEVFKPVSGLMLQYHKRFDPDVYIDAVRSFYSASDGTMLSFPWNASTGILFYNKDAFAKAGLDPEKPPKTWDEVEEFGKKLVKAGYKGFTTAWPAAYHLEHLSSWHNLPFATCANGLEGLAARFIFNDPQRVFHIGKVAEWQGNGVFSYMGRFTDEPEKLFAQEKCGILFQGANRLPLLEKRAAFPIGVGYMPYWPQFVKSPYNLSIGGASFWVMSGFNEEIYRGIVQFFEYLSAAEVQAYWHQKTGYLPITDAAYYLTKKKGFYKTHPAAEIAVLEVMENKPTSYTKGIRLGDYMTIRDKIVDQLEKIFSGEITAQEGLDEAVKEGNQMLEKFEKEHASKNA